MPNIKPKPKKISAKGREQFSIRLYIERNAEKEHIPYCEQRVGLKPGDGRKILAKKSVQADIKARRKPIRLEQMRQATIREAVVKAKAAYQRWVDPEEGSQR
jgi:hypothetical protein